MSWLSKTKLIQDFVSIKRPLDFVPHGQLCVLDCDMKGQTRFVKSLAGAYTSLLSDLMLVNVHPINANDSYIVLDGWVDIPDKALMCLNNTEYVVLSYQEHRRDSNDPTIKQTYLFVEKPILNAYNSSCVLNIVGFPIALLNKTPVGSTTLLFDTALMSVPGDMFARFRYEDNIPVLDAWQSIAYMQDKTEYIDSNTVIRRYYGVLEQPLLRELDVTSTVFIKAIPAYQSKIIPIDLSGDYRVDAFTGKTFGTGSDKLKLSISLYDAVKTETTSQTYEKNNVLSISSFLAQDFALWTTGAGTVIPETQNCKFVLDNEGHFSIGHVFLQQYLGFKSILSSQDAFKVFVTTPSGRIKYESQANQVMFEVSEVCDHLIIDIVGTPGTHINVVNLDSTARVSYLSYTYCADIAQSESWEGSCLILKPCFDRITDLYSNTDDIVLDTGIVLQ